MQSNAGLVPQHPMILGAYCLQMSELLQPQKIEYNVFSAAAAFLADMDEYPFCSFRMVYLFVYQIVL